MDVAMRIRNVMINTRKDWNESACNPFNNSSHHEIIHRECKIPYVVSIPETPYIKSVKGPLTLHPFIDVERLRTPVDGFNFTIMKYIKIEDGFVGEKEFQSHNYQNYVPYGIFRKNFYYTVTCVGRNVSGVSNISNKYPVNLLDSVGGPVDPPNQKIICGGILICDIPILCG
jgi:hypothetical protein